MESYESTEEFSHQYPMPSDWDILYSGNLEYFVTENYVNESGRLDKKQGTSYGIRGISYDSFGIGGTVTLLLRYGSRRCSCYHDLDDIMPIDWNLLLRENTKWLECVHSLDNVNVEASSDTNIVSSVGSWMLLWPHLLPSQQESIRLTIEYEISGMTNLSRSSLREMLAVIETIGVIIHCDKIIDAAMRYFLAPGSWANPDLLRILEIYRNAGKLDISNYSYSQCWDLYRNINTNCTLEDTQRTLKWFQSHPFPGSQVMIDHLHSFSSVID
jgi:hypothetical protein